jgi:hypothetical protein
VLFVLAKGEQKAMDGRLPVMSVFRPQHIIMLSWNTFPRPAWDLRYSDWPTLDCQNLLHYHAHTQTNILLDDNPWARDTIPRVLMLRGPDIYVLFYDFGKPL